MNLCILLLVFFLTQCESDKQVANESAMRLPVNEVALTHPTRTKEHENKYVYTPFVMIDTSDDANQRSALAVDVVYTSNLALANTLSTLNARNYFDQKEQLVKDYPNEVVMFSWEMPPGTRQGKSLPALPEKGGRLYGFVFADYLFPNEHRVRVNPAQNIYIHLKENAFSVRSF